MVPRPGSSWTERRFVMDSEAARIVGTALEPLEAGWNSADGNTFAQPFADDANFVAIRGDHHRGKKTIAIGHEAVFASIYKGSSIRYEVTGARRLHEQVIIGHARSTLTAPSGPLEGVHMALASIVLVRTDAQWKIAAFHNTLIADVLPSSPT